VSLDVVAANMTPGGVAHLGSPGRRLPARCRSPPPGLELRQLYLSVWSGVRIMLCLDLSRFDAQTVACLSAHGPPADPLPSISSTEFRVITRPRTLGNQVLDTIRCCHIAFKRHGPDIGRMISAEDPAAAGPFRASDLRPPRASPQVA